MMKYLFKIMWFTIGLTGLVCIRLFENTLFDDPLIRFYDNDFQNMSFPNLESWRFTFNIGFRFLLNSTISLFLIWIVFRNKNFIKFSILLYSVLLVFGLISFWWVAHDIQPKDYMVLFYIRRFLIHPILLIVLIPAFYFQKLNRKSV